MAVVESIVLGVVQGLTEFLPVSSSGHLVLGQRLFGMTEPELLFDVVLHLGTLAAVIIVLHRDLAALIREALYLPHTLRNWSSIKAAWRERPEFKLGCLVVAGSIPTGLIGVGLKDVFEPLFASPSAVGAALLLTGTVLFITRFLSGGDRNIDRFGTGRSLVIGLVQGLAITPGLSRSGLTICTGLFLGLDRELAARFSFLLFIPAILGALLLQLTSSGAGTFTAAELGLGFLAALISGLGALVLLFRVVRRGRLHYFAFYCWLIGLATLALGL